MANTIIPSQFGYTAPNSSLRSQVYIGKNNGDTFEAVGIGAGGRPDELQALKIYISKDGERFGAIHFDIEDIKTIAGEIKDLQGTDIELFLKLRTVSVCEVDDKTGEATEKKMVILGSQTY